MEITKFDPQGGAMDFEQFRLRRFLRQLDAAGELQTETEPRDLAELAPILEGNAKAVHFCAVGPEGQEVAGHVAASRARLALAFEVSPQDILSEIQKRLQNKPDVIEVPGNLAPCQQVVLRDNEADLTKLPVHLQHGFDGGPYISASTDFVVDPASGLTNVGIRRMMLRGPKEAGVDLNAPSDLRAIYEAHAARGEPLPVSFVVGSHPVDHVAAMMRLPVDELGLISILRNAPLPVVKCVTNDIRVPADAEWVIEGFFDPRGHVESEGPFGEFLGYYGEVKSNPVFHLTAITKRSDALFQTSTIGGWNHGNTETAQLNAVRTEIVVWRALQSAVREPMAVYATGSGGGAFNVRVKLRQRVPGEARNAIAAVLGCLVNVKNVFVVDPDIDIFSDEQMDWALATRFQPHRDLITMEAMRTLPLDPSLAGARVGSKAGFDLTWPFATGNSLKTRVPEPPKFEGETFSDIDAALAAGPKYFEELMTATASRDGREIVRHLDGLRSAGRLERDDEGRYILVN